MHAGLAYRYVKAVCQGHVRSFNSPSEATLIFSSERNRECLNIFAPPWHQCHDRRLRDAPEASNGTPAWQAVSARPLATRRQRWHYTLVIPTIHILRWTFTNAIRTAALG